MLRTVSGYAPKRKSNVLPHEHLQLDLRACKNDSVVLNESNMADIIGDLGHAMARYELGVVVDATVAGAGRRLDVLKRISEQTHMYIVGATGFHWDLYSEDIKCAPVSKVRSIMVDELTNGCGSEAICCGVIKVGTGSRALTAVDEKMFEAAGLASRDTEDPLITHTSREEHAIWQVERFEEVGIDLAKVVIGHLDKYQNAAELALEVGRRGAFIGIDQIGFSQKRPDEERAELVRSLCEEGLERHIVLPSDIASVGRLRIHGGTGYSTVFEHFLALLRREGLEEHMLTQITCGNPQEWLGVAE